MCSTRSFDPGMTKQNLLKCGNLYKRIWYFDHPVAPKLLKTATDALGLGGRTKYQARHSGPAAFCARDQNFAKSSNDGRWPPLFPSPAPKQVGTIRVTCRGAIDKTIPSPTAHKRMTGKYMPDVFGELGTLAKASNLRGLHGHVLETKFGTRYDVTQSPVLIGIRQDVSVGRCVNDFTSTTTHFVLFPSYSRECFHR